MPAVLERRAGLPQLVLLLAGSCLSVLGAVLIAPVLPQMTDHFAGVPGADVLVPIVLTVPALIIGLTAPFAGFIADRIDRKRVLIIAMVGYTVFGTAPLYLDTLGSIIGSRVLVGLCEAAIMTCCTTLIADYWSGPRRSRYLGLQTLLASVSATVFLGLGGALGSSGWRTPFWLYLVAAVLAVPMALLIWQPAASGGKGPLPPVPWRRLRTPCLVTLAGGIAFYALIVELSFVLDEAGVTATATIGALSALMSLATAIAAGSFAKLSGRTPRQLLPVAFGLAAAGFLVIWSNGSVPVITVGAVLTGAGTGLLLPVLLTWATNGLSFAERGRGTGLWTGTLFVGQFLSPILITGLAGAFGGLRPALGVLGILAAILAVATLRIVPRDAGPLNVTHD
ncbi:MFS transporter [Actinoplanes xinjiangensis]|jgi:MFS family permease|uniref:Putative MFS family arabinose efflux permease n=1 Tax=Actinoplanes xinjiangensis TaxID=512350 RepID=A0A316EIQ1_9ACTN|nr:MFS transporter [Actinoplanes xinjiangensis]PWK29799.1 putative MFS family arabinose efflux permease [Actinoplanes xinjiangensis]GIF44831.1 MFS transporter [Actinoplanes xinjiangensis]